MSLKSDIAGHWRFQIWIHVSEFPLNDFLVPSYFPEHFWLMWVFKPTPNTLHLIIFHIAFTTANYSPLFLFNSSFVHNISQKHMKSKTLWVCLPQIPLSGWKILSRTWQNAEWYDITLELLKGHFKTEILQVQI